MRALSLTVCAVLLNVVAANAADLPVKAPAAHAVAATISPTDVYIGLQGGYGWAGIRPNGADVNAFLPGLTYSDPAPARGLLGGVTVGSNRYLGDWVFGIEGDFSWSNVKGSFDGVSTGGVNVHVDARLDWLATARGRVGYGLGSALLYATGGAALARISGSNTNSGGGFSVTSDEAHTHAGWTVGAGVEYAFAPHWSAKLEGLYVGLSEQRYQNVRFRGDIGIVRAGLNWHF